MIIKSLINQNIPIWAVIKGDHACVESIKKINKNLIEKPNFMDSLENELRKTVLKNSKDRKWLFDYLYDKSFAISELEKEDFLKVNTVFKDIKFNDLYKKYKSCPRGFVFKKLKKTKEDVAYVKNMSKSIDIKELTRFSWHVDEISNPLIMYDFNRSIWLKKKNNQYTIIDGTHRMLAFACKFLHQKKMPKLYCITVNE